ncbi:hypothetical protein MBANPS3_003107 [Mucor bainieri]
MFNNILTVTKALFQQFELKTTPNVFDPYQTEQFYQELNQDIHAGSSFDLSLSEEEDTVLVDKMEVEEDACFVNGYCIDQPSLMAVVAAKGMIKKVSSGAFSAYSTAHSGKDKLQKALHLVSVEEEVPIMRGYGVDFCPLFERPYDSNFCVDLTDRRNRRCHAHGDSVNKYIDIPMKTFSAIETENNPWELV